MTRSLFRFAVVGAGAAMLVLALGGCNNGDDSSSGGAGAVGGAGAGGSGGGVTDKYTIQTCPGVVSAEPAGLSSLPLCDGQCPATAHCVPATLAGADNAETLSAERDSCVSLGDAPGVCIPDEVAYMGSGKFVPKPCTANAGGQGVCLPKCFVSPVYRDILVIPECGVEEVCAPCRNSLNGKDSGACTDRCAAQ